jgi:hypothetical protein
MTFGVVPGNTPGQLKLSYTYGPVTVHMDEHVGHLRAFWHDLGVKLEEAEKAERAAE